MRDYSNKSKLALTNGKWALTAIAALILSAAPAAYAQQSEMENLVRTDMLMRANVSNGLEIIGGVTDVLRNEEGNAVE